MIDQRDPGLQALFDAAPVVPASDTFVRQVMTDIDRQRRRTMTGWILAGAMLTPVAWWLSGPVISTFYLAAKLMPESLVTIESALLSQVLAPVNSLAGVAGLLFLGGWMFYRKFIRG